VSGALVTSAISLAAYFNVIALPQLLMGGPRIKGFFKDANVYAPFLIVALLLLWSFPLVDRVPALFRIGSTVVLLATVLFAFSRAGWINLAVSLAIYGALRIVERPSRLFSIGGRVALLIAPCLWLLPRLEAGFGADAFLRQRVGLQAYDGLRFETQHRAWNQFTESPLTGHGPLSTKFNLGLGTHNIFLQLLYENGVIALLLFLALGGLGLYAGFRAIQFLPPFATSLAIAIIASLVGLAANSLAIDSLHWRHMWILIGFAIGLPALAERTWHNQEHRH
jgi:O-antigen ligase